MPEALSRYWVRFKLFGTDDYRSLVFPPIGILGYWCTGYGCECSVICCVIDTNTFEDITKIVNENFIGSPNEKADIDFVDKKPNNWVPSGDRYPLEHWMEALRKDSENVSVDGETG